MLHNYILIESTEQESKVSKITDHKALIQTIHRHFAMPADIVSEVMEYLPDLKDVWI